MSEHPIQKSGSLNAGLVALVLILNFVVIGGLVLSNMPPAQDGGQAVAALAEPTSVPPSDTPTSVPPSLTPTSPPTSTPMPPSPTPTPSLTSTPMPPSPTPTSPPVESGASGAAAYDPALVARGEQLYMQCGACHGADGRGVPNLGKDLVDSAFVHALTDEALLQFIIVGRPIWDPDNTTGIDMPGKGGNPALSNEDILAIIAYIRSLSVGG